MAGFNGTLVVLLANARGFVETRCCDRFSDAERTSGFLISNDEAEVLGPMGSDFVTASAISDKS